MSRHILTAGFQLLFPLLGLGCCAIGDPSCDVPRELYGSQFGRNLAYCPDTALEGLPCESWYCDPTGWTPECQPAVQCGPQYLPPAESRAAVYALPEIRPLSTRPLLNPQIPPPPVSD
ncbi:MAG TPA: hypothetical protein DDY91_05920 [Planctomycetaceae bacterium]|jgi:hypothetical protein|nr:hypothetical protein [Planctomycetaceae bacterium]